MTHLSPGLHNLSTDELLQDIEISIRRQNYFRAMQAYDYVEGLVYEIDVKIKALLSDRKKLLSDHENSTEEVLTLEKKIDEMKKEIEKRKEEKKQERIHVRKPSSSSDAKAKKIQAALDAMPDEVKKKMSETGIDPRSFLEAHM